MRIIAIAGALKGSEFPIGEIAFTIGRQEDNDVCLEDDLVSRKHCEIQLQDGRAVLRDLQSRNGTFVNGEAISQKVLRHGDGLKVGSSTFIYRESDDIEEIAPEYIDRDHDRARNVKTLRARRDDALFPHAVSLQIGILHSIFANIPSAKRAAVLLVDRNRAEFAAAMHRPSAFRVSGLITHQVLADGLPILRNDENSVVCAALGISGTKIGVIYADNPDPAAFHETHLLQLKTLADLASAGFETTRYVEWLEGENHRLQQEIDLEHEMIGQSAKMHEVYSFIQRVGRTFSNVLILGQSGTGKGLVARAIHKNSSRRNRPCISVNCAAITESLLESELFGHEKGAFTGAMFQRKGKIEIADGGTLFLDEIGETSSRMQAALLRVIEDKEFERVGGTRTIKVDVRIVAATNRNLEQAVKEGRFREDLYHRLNVFSITLPPLSGRRHDIPMLADHFIRKYGLIHGVSGITPEAMQLLVSYDWPGNVRELGNAIERAAGLGSSDLIRPEDLPEAIRERKARISRKMKSYNDGVNDAKRALIDEALQVAGGNKREAAELLDLDVSFFNRLIRALYEKKDTDPSEKPPL